MGHFLPFYHLKSQNFEKMEKLLRYHNFTHVYQKPQYMMYGFWDTEWDRQNLLSFWATFCPFTTLTTWETKILKKWKKHLEISSSYTFVPQMKIIWCMVPQTRSMTEIFFILDYKSKFWKNEKTKQQQQQQKDTIILHMCTINKNHMMYGSWERERNRETFF